MKLLKEMQNIFSPSGEEENMKNFIIEYVKKNNKNWKMKPKIIHGEEFQNCVVLIFGKPRCAIFSHIDSIGFTVGYDNELIKLGGPVIKSGIKLIGSDSKGEIKTKIIFNKKTKKISCDFKRSIDRGTNLVFEPYWRESEKYIQNCYMDNRLGVWSSLKVAENLTNGIIVFSCWEETGGGSVGYLAKYIYEKYNVRQALISDITWVTKGIKFNYGTVVSARDSAIPNRTFIKKIINILKEHKIKFQIEVESSGGSDGNQLQKSPFPFDWCFIGPPEENVHSPDEKVNKLDIIENLKAYEILMKNL